MFSVRLRIFTVRFCRTLNPNILVVPPFDLKLEKCHTCVLNKITKNPYPSVTRQTVLLELVHSDLCDFHSSPSLGNKKYIVTFIDDFSRFCYIYLLFTKDEALEKFKTFKIEVELQLNQKIKRLRTDRGGEYLITRLYTHFLCDVFVCFHHIFPIYLIS